MFDHRDTACRSGCWVKVSTAHWRYTASVKELDRLALLRRAGMDIKFYPHPFYLTLDLKPGRRLP